MEDFFVVYVWRSALQSRFTEQIFSADSITASRKYACSPPGKQRSRMVLRHKAFINNKRQNPKKWKTQYENLLKELNKATRNL